MMLRHFFTALLIVVAFSANAQDFTLGKVSLEELQQKNHPSDPSAEAAVLYTKGKTYFEYSASSGFYSMTEVEVRIKIYKKEGYKWSNKAISFYVGGMEDQMVSFSKAATYNLINGQIEKTKLKGEGEFTEKVNRYASLKKIAMPNVREGSVIEYSYTIKSPYFQNLPDWDFQKSIPVDYSEYKILIPEYFKYNSYLKGTLEPRTETTSALRNFTGVSSEMVNQGGGYRRERYEYDVSCLETTKTYSLSNIEAFKEEEYTNNADNYTSSIAHELASVHFKDGPFTNYTINWESVARKVYSFPEFGGELQKTNYFENDLRPILTGDDYQRIGSIFNFVTSRMAWNSHYGYLCESSVKKAYAEKSGNAAEINLMLVAMLRYAGLDANPVLLSTRSNGVAHYPNLTAFNSVIAAVKLDNRLILMDATSKYAIPGMLPPEDLNWTGRMINDDGTSSLVVLVPSAISKKSYNMMASIDAEGKVSGKIRCQHADYHAFMFREDFLDMKRDDYLQELENKFDGIAITDYSIENDRDLSKPITETLSFSDNRSLETVGGKLYFSPMLFLAGKINPFKQDKRLYPIDFIFPSQWKHTISIKIPEGYIAETLPQSSAVEIEDGIGSFKYGVSSSQNQLQIVFTVDINRAIVGPEYYETLKSFFKAMIEKQNEKIVLKKI